MDIHIEISHDELGLSLEHDAENIDFAIKWLEKTKRYFAKVEKWKALQVAHNDF